MSAIRHEQSQYVHNTFAFYTGIMTGNYKAFLLRLQREHSQDHWRVTLVDAFSGKEQHFASERALYIHLTHTLAQESLPSDEAVEDVKEKD